MKVRSAKRPEQFEFAGNSIFVASNITPYEETVDGHVLSGFEYDCEEYNKDTYLVSQAAKIASLEEELQATKILLGVE